MDTSNCFITKLVDGGELNSVLRQGITPDFFDGDTGGVYRYILNHYKEYKSIPSRDAVTRAFPDHEFGEAPEPISYYIDELKDSYRRVILEEKLDEVARVYIDDTHKAETLLRDTLSEIQIAGTTIQDIDFAASAPDRYQTYLSRKANPGADGILSKWSALDYQTLGWHPEEFIVLVGEKYVGKSWAMLWMALQAALQKQRVLFITKEMSQEAILRRVDSIYARVCFDSLRRGELSGAEESRYAKALEELGANECFHFRVARNGINTIENIEEKAREVNADIIFGDSIYLFDPDNRSTFKAGMETQRRQAVSHACKIVATNLGIPFVASVQAGRNKRGKDGVPSLDDIEWSNAFAQDGDTVFFVQKDDLDLELKRSQMFLLKSRDGDRARWFINQDYVTMDFSERADESEPTIEVFKEDDILSYNGQS